MEERIKRLEGLASELAKLQSLDSIKLKLRYGLLKVVIVAVCVTMCVVGYFIGDAYKHQTNELIEYVRDIVVETETETVEDEYHADSNGDDGIAVAGIENITIGGNVDGDGNIQTTDNQDETQGNG